jgi:hypothetical protein
MRRGYGAALAIAGVLFMLAQTEKGKQAVAGTANAVGAAVRGIRNNNPGNIRRGNKWQGLAPVQTDPSFDQFVSMEYGCRALARVLATYRSQGLNTVRKIINKYAPPVENNTSAYVNAVASYLGVTADQVIDIRMAWRMAQLMRAIIRHEVGVVASALVTDSAINAGIAMAA